MALGNIEAAASKKPFLWNELQVLEQIERILDVYNKLKYGDDRSKYIKFLAAYPDYVFATTGTASLNSNAREHKLICYDISRKESGSEGEMMFSSKKRVRPTLMEATDAIINSGREDEKTIKVETYRKIYDLMYRFDCLAPSDTQSLELIREFEKIMEIHSRYLELGCHRFMYVGRKPSYFNRDTNYKSRTCEFFAQIEEQWTSTEDRIEDIEIRVKSLLDRS